MWAGFQRWNQTVGNMLQWKWTCSFIYFMHVWNMYLAGLQFLEHDLPLCLLCYPSSWASGDSKITYIFVGELLISTFLCFSSEPGWLVSTHSMPLWHTCTHPLYIYIYTYTYIYIYIYACIIRHICTCVCIYIYILHAPLIGYWNYSSWNLNKNYKKQRFTNELSQLIRCLMSCAIRSSTNVLKIPVREVHWQKKMVPLQFRT